MRLKNRPSDPKNTELTDGLFFGNESDGCLLVFCSITGRIDARKYHIIAIVAVI